jgi:Protein of unknown function (DUF2637)
MAAGRWRPSAPWLIQWSAAAALVLGAGVVGFISYGHAVAVVKWAGEHGAVAYLYPVTIDGLIYVSSMVMLDAARRRERAPGIARALLLLGIVATVGANLAAGIPYGTGLRAFVRLCVFGWPAPVVVLMYELLMVLIRRRAAAAAAEPAQLPNPTEPVGVPRARYGSAAADDSRNDAPMRQQRGRAPGRRRAPAPAAAASNGGAPRG